MLKLVVLIVKSLGKAKRNAAIWENTQVVSIF
jgi:hypothetical protein